LASSAASLESSPRVIADELVRPAAALTARAIDWPCLAAPSLLHAWDALARFAVEPNPFHESWFLLPALRGLDPDEAVRMLLCESADVIAAAMPIARRSRYYGRRVPHLALWDHPNGFLGAPLVAHGFERAFWRAVLAWADRRPGKAAFLHIAGLPLGGALHRALAEVVEAEDRLAGIVHREERAMLQAGASPEDYFAQSLSGKKRKELRRQLARLSELGEVAFVRQSDGAGLLEWIDRFLAIEVSGWKGKAGSALIQNKATETLFREGLLGAATHGRLERLSLTLDGRPIAMLANFVCPPGAFSFKTTYDEAYARFSPGVLLQCENLLVLDRADIAWTDSCAAQDHPMIDHIWRERRTVGSVSIAIGGRLRRAAFARLLAVELRGKPKGLEA
jgi:hypothetical protein